ncbi:MAG: hypothetical protein NT120_04400 [Candidatus Aenigmarchaeota archaeon]|nr:hypothetical protein [Candidatus Aenigmarchaeota archaeon]
MENEVQQEHKEDQKEEHHEHKEAAPQEHKEKKSFFSRFRKKSEAEEKINHDWKFGFFFLGVIILLFMQSGFTVLAVWAIIWSLLLMYFDKA